MKYVDFVNENQKWIDETWKKLDEKLSKNGFEAETSTEIFSLVELLPISKKTEAESKTESWKFQLIEPIPSKTEIESP